MLVWIIWFEMKMVQIKKCYQMSQISLNALIQQQERKQVLSLPIYRVLYKHNTVTVFRFTFELERLIVNAITQDDLQSNLHRMQFSRTLTYDFYRCIVVPNWWRSDLENEKKTLELNVIFNKLFESAWFNENVIV